jgi:hypothetical protein
MQRFDWWVFRIGGVMIIIIIGGLPVWLSLTALTTSKAIKEACR